MTDIKFNPKKLSKLNDPDRLKIQDPKAFWSKLNLNTPETIVDIGVGTGFFAVEFLKLEPSAKVIGLDIEPSMLEWIKENRQEYQEKRLYTKLMTESSLPLEDGLADLITMINLHHELHEPMKILKECYRVLKPSGKIFTLDWKVMETPKGPPAKIRVAPDKVEEQFKKSGFEQVKTEEPFEWFYVVIGQKPQ